MRTGYSATDFRRGEMKPPIYKKYISGDFDTMALFNIYERGDFA